MNNNVRENLLRLARRVAGIAMGVTISFIILVATDDYNKMKKENYSLRFAKQELLNLQNDYDKLKSKCDSVEQENFELSVAVVNMTEVVLATDDKVDQMAQDNLELQKDYKSLEKKYKKLSKRKELYDKYGYAIIDEDGSRTDLDYDSLKYGAKLMEEKGYNPHILFSMGMVESNFRTHVTMESSGAAGFLQITPGTGKFIYENLMGKPVGSYHKNTTPYDSKKNIELAVTYLDYLFEKWPTKFRAIQQYCGGTPSFTRGYINRMARYSKNHANIWRIIKN